MSDLAMVWTIRPYDTTEGFKQPGDEYERIKADADKLAGQGVVELVSAKARKKGES